MKNKSDYAFPGKGPYGEERGMSLRDWFAGQALTAVLTIHFQVAQTGIFKDDNHAHENAANKAYALADAMLKEREKQ